MWHCLRWWLLLLLSIAATLARSCGPERQCARKRAPSGVVCHYQRSAQRPPSIVVICQRDTHTPTERPHYTSRLAPTPNTRTP